ncbi:MAG: DUF2339 domain-containing protein [Oscillospiraceae bacterium]|nr:DUF2339 domain-containing protein [Oscillospiraceae bacterium]
MGTFLLFLFTFIGFLVLGAKISNQKREIDALTQQIRNLRSPYRANSLEDLKEYMREEGKEEVKEEFREEPRSSAAVYFPSAVHLETPTEESIVVTETPTPIMREPTLVAAPIMRDTTPVAPHIPVEQKTPKKFSMTESWVGRNLLGIAASVLIFIGLIFLGVLIYEHITDSIKITLMFVLSAAITGLGVFLAIKKRNAFTEILTGCGCGSFFISIMITHIYFDRLDEIAAFSLLLVWLAAVLYLSKRISSVSTSIVAHIGMIISICFAYSFGLTDDKMLLLFIYQMASVAVIVAGNIFCCKQTYRFGLFVSLGLTVITGIIMWDYFPSGFVADAYLPFAGTTLPVPFISAVFIAQFVSASFLSYLLSLSTDRLENNGAKLPIHFGNKILWIIVLFMNIYRLVYRLAYSSVYSSGHAELSAIGLAVLVGIGIAVLHSCVSVFMKKRFGFSSMLETVSVVLMSVITSLMLLILWLAQFGSDIFLPRIPLLIIPALLLILAKRVSGNKSYMPAFYSIFFSDLFLMLVVGYRQLTSFGTIWLAIGYMFIYLAVIWGLWLSERNHDSTLRRTPAHILSYLIGHASLIVIFLVSSLPHKEIILLMTLTVINILLVYLKYDSSKKSLYTIMRTAEFILIAASSACIAFMTMDGTLQILLPILAALTAILALTRIKSYLWHSMKHAEEALYMLKITAISAAVVYGYTNSLANTAIYMLLLMTVLGIGFYIARVLLYKKHEISFANSPIDMPLRALEFILIAASSACIAFMSMDGALQILLPILAALTAGLALTRIKSYLWHSLRHAEEALYMLKITAISAAVVYGYTNSLAHTAIYMLILMTVLGIGFYIARVLLYKKHEISFANLPIDLPIRFLEFILIAASSFCIAFALREGALQILLPILAALTAGLAFMRVNHMQGNKLEEILTGIKLTGLIMALVHGNTSWFDNAYILSFVCMITALVCIVVGFIYRAKSLRQYGLVLTLMCVIKLVTFDVSGQDTYLRVVTLIGGGIICFIISAIYSYSVKKLDEE